MQAALPHTPCYLNGDYLPVSEAKVSVLKEQVEHHVYEEERQRGSIFAQVRKADIDLVALGAQMAELKAQLQKQAKAEGLPRPEMVALARRFIEAIPHSRELGMRLESLGDTDIPSKTIGEIVMESLARIDTVAYVRFASVYRNFNEAKDFQSFLGDLDKEG